MSRVKDLSIAQLTDLVNKLNEVKIGNDAKLSVDEIALMHKLANGVNIPSQVDHVNRQIKSLTNLHDIGLEDIKLRRQGKSRYEEDITKATRKYNSSKNLESFINRLQEIRDNVRNRTYGDLTVKVENLDTEEARLEAKYEHDLGLLMVKFSTAELYDNEWIKKLRHLLNDLLSCDVLVKVSSVNLRIPLSTVLYSSTSLDVSSTGNILIVTPHVHVRLINKTNHEDFIEVTSSNQGV